MKKTDSKVLSLIVSFFALSAYFSAPAFAETAYLYPTADALINELAPSWNGGSGSPILQTQLTTGSGTSLIRRTALIKYNLSSVPSGARITSAKISINMFGGSGRASVPYTLSRITQDWSENSVTWQNKPGIADPKVNVSVDLTSGFKEWDVTSIAGGWFNGSYYNYGIYLAGPATGDLYMRGFRSREEASVNGGARLAITYTLQNTNLVGPQISNVVITKPTTTTVNVAYTTSRPATSEIKYGVNAGSTTSSVSSAGSSTAHSLNIENLTPNKVYYYKIIAKDSANIENTYSADFVTAARDGTKPLITNVRTSNTTFHGTMINWDTNEPADTRVEYSLDSSFATRDVNTSSNNATYHSVTVSNLLANTTYNYRVKSKDAAGNEGVSANLTFKTLEDPNQITVSNIREENVTGTGASIKWSSNLNSDSIVIYRADGGRTMEKTGNANTKAHAVELSGLADNKKYFYRVRSRTTTRSEVTSPEKSFTTKNILFNVDTSGLIPAFNITAVKVKDITAHTVTVVWTTDWDTNSRVEYSRNNDITDPRFGNYAENLNYTKEHSIYINNLRPNTAYLYRVRSVNKSGVVKYSKDDVPFTTKSESTGSSGGSGSSVFDPRSGAKDPRTTAGSGNSSSTGGSSGSSSLCNNPLFSWLPGCSKGNTGTNTRGTGGGSSGQTGSLSGSGGNGGSPGTTGGGPSSGTGSGTGGNSGGSPGSSGDSSGTPPRGGAVRCPDGSTGWSNNTQSGDVLKLYNVCASNITETTAKVSWTTSMSSNAEVRYWVSNGGTVKSSKVSDTGTNHNVSLSGLTPNTGYSFMAISETIRSQSNNSGLLNFATAAGSGPSGGAGNGGNSGFTIEWVRPENVEQTSAAVTWSTGDTQTVGYVNYVEDSAVGQATRLDDNEYSVQHSRILTGLLPNTHYLLTVTATDRQGRTQVKPGELTTLSLDGAGAQNESSADQAGEQGSDGSGTAGDNGSSGTDAGMGAQPAGENADNGNNNGNGNGNGDSGNSGGGQGTGQPGQGGGIGAGAGNVPPEVGEMAGGQNDEVAADNGNSGSQGGGGGNPGGPSAGQVSANPGGVFAAGTPLGNVAAAVTGALGNIPVVRDLVPVSLFANKNLGGNGLNPTSPAAGGTQAGNPLSKVLPQILILLIILAVLFFALRKKKPSKVLADNKSTEKPEEKKPSLPAQPEKVVGEVKTTTKTRGKGLPIFKLIFVLLGLYILVSVLQTLLIFGDPRFILTGLLDEIGKGRANFGSSKAISFVNTSAGSAGVSSLDTNANLTLKGVAESAWPSGSVGGMYELLPSGTFEGLAKVSLTLKETAKKGFTLGYFVPESKKWTRIPTIQRGQKTYEGYLTHASLVTGSTVNGNNSSISGSSSSGVAGAGEFRFRDSLLQQTWEDVQKRLGEIQHRLDNGTGGGEGDSNWTGIKNDISRMAPTVIGNCRGTPSLEDRMEFLQVMSVAQVYGFDVILIQFQTAWDRCIPLAKEAQNSSYVIKQTDTTPYDLNLTGLGSSHMESTSISDGVVVKNFSGQKYGWQGDWQVVQNVSTKGNTNVQLNLGPLSSSAVSGNANSKSVVMLLFSLKDVAVGQEFTIYSVTLGNYEQESFGPPQDVILYLNNEIFATGRVEPNDRIVTEKGGVQIKAKLEQDLGNDGAVVSVGGGTLLDSLTGTQGDAVRQYTQMMKENPYLSKLYDEAFNKPVTPIKLRIKKSGI